METAARFTGLCTALVLAGLTRLARTATESKASAGRFGTRGPTALANATPPLERGRAKPGGRVPGQSMLDATLDVSDKHLLRFRRVARQSAIQKRLVLPCGDLAPEDHGDHLIAKVLVVDRRVRPHEDRRAAGGDQGVVKLPVAAFPDLRVRRVASNHAPFHDRKLVVRGHDPALPVQV